MRTRHLAASTALLALCHLLAGLEPRELVLALVLHLVVDLVVPGERHP